MPWQIQFTRQARRHIQRLPARDRDAIQQRLRTFVLDPGSADLKKLGGREDEWRVRVGRWRVIIVFDNRTGMMTVRDVLPRDRAY